ncbi:hypothetical protein H7U18_10710 [Klebsiella pneumoniae]|uniref:Uncharacterized protein n=1 Tax=Klebsiella pneumoniae TaxID=573 RepID=A0A923J7A2_KLEPN|nr:hypothetical protein [Klebsiella pneumoniae]
MSYLLRGELHHADGAGVKSGFAVAEVVEPHPAEALIKAELFNILPAWVKRCRQCAVVRA